MLTATREAETGAGAGGSGRRPRGTIRLPRQGFWTTSPTLTTRRWGPC
ncbi:unnamed protein product [Ascophyllum nodosum]